MPTTVLAAKTVVAAGVLALAATGTAVAFAAPTSRPEQATARVTAAHAHRAQHATGTAATQGPTTAATHGPATPATGDDTSRDSSAPGKPVPATAGKANGARTVSAQAFGLCTAFAHGGLATQSVAYASLVKAAGGAANIRSYCATIAHPGHPGGTPARPTVKPTDRGHRG